MTEPVAWSALPWHVLIPWDSLAEQHRVTIAERVAVVLPGEDAAEHWEKMGAVQQREWLQAAEHPDAARGAYEADVARLNGRVDAESNAAFDRLTTPRTTADLLDDLCQVLHRFIVWSAAADVHFLALWVLHTYVFDLFDVTPYVHITSPSKRAGKSRLLELLVLLVANPWSVFDASEAVLFRKVDKVRPTLLADEIDATFGKDSKVTEGLRAIYNVGYKRGATVARCVGNAMEPRDFEVYCPKAFAGIGGLPDTVADRSGRVTLRRRAPNEPKPERFRVAAVRAEMAPLRERLGLWAKVAEDAGLGEAVPSLPESLNDRAHEVCEVLAAIADMAGGEWPERARRAFLAVMGEDADTDYGVVLLRHCWEAFYGRPDEDDGEGDNHHVAAADEDMPKGLPTAKLLRLLVDRGDDSPWARWWGDDVDHDRTRGPGARLAALLAPYGIRSRQVWIPEPGTPTGGHNVRGYRLTDFADAWERYVPSLYVPKKDARTLESTSEAIFGRAAQNAKTAFDQGSSVLASKNGTWTIGQGLADADDDGAAPMTEAAFDRAAEAYGLFDDDPPPLTDDDVDRLDATAEVSSSAARESGA